MPEPLKKESDPSAALSPGLTPARVELLGYLKAHPGATLTELSTALWKTRSSMREVLASMGHDGLVTSTTASGGRGRPAQKYFLTEAADALFPAYVERLGMELMRHLSREQPELLATFLGRFLRDNAQLYGETRNESFEQRCVAMFGELKRACFFPQMSIDEKGATFVLVHCPFLSAAKEIPGICENEAAIFGELFPEARVARTQYRLDGDGHCAYRVSRRLA